MIGLSHNGIEVAVSRRGVGEKVILIHGALGDFRTWESQMEILGEHFDVIAYSRRGHFPAQHVDRAQPYTADAHAADLIALIESLGGSPVRLVGHSFGGAVGALVALREPRLVRSLVLAEPSLFSLLRGHPEGAAALADSVVRTAPVRTHLRQGRMDLALAAFIEVVFGPDFSERLPDKIRSQMLENMHTLEPMLAGMNAGTRFRAEHAQQLQVPTLLSRGEQTEPVFRWTTDLLAQLIPGAEYHVLPGLTHGLHLESPETFGRLLMEYFRRQELFGS